MTSIYKAVNDLIVKYTTYSNDVIFKNFYNNVTLPKNNHYCLINLLYARPQMALLRLDQVVDIDNQTVDTGYTQMVDTRMQIDMYGSQAQTQAERFATIMQSPIATNFLKALGYTVRTCDCPEQLSNSQDRGNYVDRFIVRFSLFSNSTVNEVIEGFDTVIINPVLTETL